jgi:GTP-binding protein EngB required for normal cell division
MRGLRERLINERLQLAVLGQFKRGKSTFLNALLGAPLLPTGVVPLTAVATFIRWGPEPSVRISFRDDCRSETFAVSEPDVIRDCLFRFVAEEANPRNRLGVAGVELVYPAPILADGTVLIDTPGVGSTLKHNTEAARAVLPECDAVLFVLSADPPITETELEYLSNLGQGVGRVFFILNKIDYLQPDERRNAADFLRKVLSDTSLLGPDGNIFNVSARDGLDGKRRNDRDAVQRSGIATLEEHLVRYLATEKACALEEALRRKAAGLLEHALAEMGLRARALRMPIQELEAKSQAFEQALLSIEEQQRIMRDLLEGDKRSLREKLESTIASLRVDAVADLSHIIGESLADPSPRQWHERCRDALGGAIERIFDAAREHLALGFAGDTTATLSAHQERIDSLVEKVQRTAAQIFDVEFPRHVEREAFKLGEDPYWVTERIPASLIPDVGGTIDRLLPIGMRRARVRARLMEQAHQLVIRNAENLRWAILRGLDETFRSATARLEECLDEAIAATRGVIRQALIRRHDRSFAIQPEIESLGSGERSAKELLRDIAGKGVVVRGQSAARGMS